MSDLTVYTVGHSNSTITDFVALLSKHGIRILVDVRSSPYSQYAPQFNREALKADPEMKELKYLYAGKQLGGRPENHIFYDEEGYVLYNEIANTYTFEEGIDKLLELARKFPTAVMCSEESPLECHRRLLIGRVLGEQGVQVLHLRHDGRVQSEEELQLEENDGQLSLLLTDMPEEKPWRSTRSVLPKKAPQNSSEY